MSHPSRVDDDAFVSDDQIDDKVFDDDSAGEEFLGSDDDDSFGPTHRTYQELEEEEEDLEDAPSPYYPGIDVCIVCQKRPPYSRGGKSYPTCGLTCARALEMAMNQTGPPPRRNGDRPRRSKGSPEVPPSPAASALRQFFGKDAPHSPRNHRAGSSRQPSRAPVQPATTTTTALCVVCSVKPCHDSRYVTCGLTCAERLCTTGGANANLCDYCHRYAKLAGENQCSDACKASAKLACLMCRSRPKHKRYHLCGKTCREIAVKQTPLILEVPKGHVTYDMVENKFTNSWKFPNTRIPTIQRIYKIIENKTFLQPYEQYKKAVGNEVFRYHGTKRKCTLGAPGNTKLCTDTTCPLCSILKTSFKTSLANPGGAFGAGVYSSSASNKAYSYTTTGAGAMLLTKVVLGTVRKVNGWNEVMACPPGFHSVVFERHNDCLNETIVYSDDAIRPVFLIMF